MREQSRPTDPSEVPTLATLITDRKAARGWTYRQLQALSGEQITSQRWQQLATGVRLNEFPEPATLRAIADAIGVDITAVLLSVASSLGLPVKHRVSELAAMLPPAAHELTAAQRDAVLAVVKAMNPKETDATQEQEPEQGQRSTAGRGAGRTGAPMKPPSREAARRRQESALSRAETAGHPNPEEVAALDQLGRKAHSTSQSAGDGTERDQ